MRIFPVNLATFEQPIFWLMAHLVCHRKLLIQADITRKIKIGIT